MKKTPLFERHQKLKATMIEFGGWCMPVQYTAVIEEHRATRSAAGLFDICHMGEIEVRGPGARELLQSVMSRNLDGQEIGQMKLSVMPNVRGGIIDDLTVYRLGDEHYMVVTNAATKDGDWEWILKAHREKGSPSVTLRDISYATGKIDLQGPKSQTILQKITSGNLAPLKFYHFMSTDVLGIPSIVSRSGYTGEDGFEIYADSRRIGDIFDALLNNGTPMGLKPVGLGARDTLRIESGLMLYGHEIDETVTPYEVVYGWIVDLTKDFIGREALRKQKEEGAKKKLIGFEMTDRGIARHGYKVFGNGREIGRVTSGTFAPTLGKALGFAFVDRTHESPGSEIEIEIRSQHAKARVVPLPFYRRPQT
ncbi:MAG TPA: glycine cleavage system aminomethyltransferase GcvT [Syntrophales bacterium]|nr:glycine cleavage system aminomethyltransferase GcvT [Syntrophales bacterium]HOX94115.1 glycine cleavage system aminomethyltransferase GcvT [Syntrophales bacterium]HPI55964.1 glycine cleavage system aminomethyltransferase GcvT [Syntrophales bacterium]HPN24146.1 glycine cleavage system aminomethyltransferase GcvT [Syntrophales bacterium]HQM28425.1 glycine cleavage system aminomethyltransferase GcvT [Syntrophales bacterium]